MSSQHEFVDNQDYQDEALLTEDEDLLEGQQDNEEEDAADDATEASYAAHADDGRQEEEAEPEPERYEKPKRKKSSFKTRFNQINRERYQALDKAKKLEEENAHLRQMAEEYNSKMTDSTFAAMSHYDMATQMRLESAKEKKRRAKEDGDIQAEIDADMEMATAANDLYQINSWKAQKEMDEGRAEKQYAEPQRESTPQYEQSYNPQQYARPSAPVQPPQEQINQETYNWIEQHSWLNPRNKDYDPVLTDAVVTRSAQIDEYLHQHGRPELIRSPAYYKELDNYVSQMQNQGRQIPMKNSNQYMEPAGRGHPQGRQKQVVKLTAQEKEMAQAHGVTEAAYLKAKLTDQKERPERWRY